METLQGNQGNQGLQTPPMFSAFKTDKQISFIRAYDPKATITEGYRHAVIRFREVGKNSVAKPAQMVTVPCVSLTDEYLLPAKAQQVLIGVIEDAQDEIIRAAITGNTSIIEWASISLDACLENLTATRVSQRLTKEQIENWVNVAMVDCLRARGKQNSASKGFAEGSENELKQVAATINQYRELYSRLSAPVPNVGQEQANALKNMLAVSKLDDDIAKSLGKRIHAILNPVAVETGDL